MHAVLSASVVRKGKRNPSTIHVLQEISVYIFRMCIVPPFFFYVGHTSFLLLLILALDFCIPFLVNNFLFTSVFHNVVALFCFAKVEICCWKLPLPVIIHKIPIGTGHRYASTKLALRRAHFPMFHSNWYSEKKIVINIDDSWIFQFNVE